MTDAFIFAGPTLSLATAQEKLGLDAHGDALILENGKRITFLPPVSEGDVFQLVARHPAIIGIIDGYFENIPSVWHKEILFAMAQGIHVLGASSMGALRAAELAAFGMEGIGEVYRGFATKVLEDDDDVAVVHGPEELAFPPLSEAMVNIRPTLHLAVTCNILRPEEAALLIRIAKGIFYKERNYRKIIETAFRQGLDPDSLSALEEWLVANRVDQKRADAIELLETVSQRLMQPTDKKQVLYHFEETILWKNARKPAHQKDSNVS